MRALLGTGALLVAAAFVGLRARDTDAPGAVTPPAALAATAPAMPAVAPLPPQEKAPPAAADETMLLLPDGSRVEALNGARSPKPLSDAWPAGVPWSAIVGIEHSPAGIDWYVHADGSRSTTEMVWRSDLGRYDATTRLARPTPTVPMLAPK